MPSGYVPVKYGRRAGNRLRQLEVSGIFRLTKVERVVQFLKDDELSALSGHFFDIGGRLPHVFLHIGYACLLDDTCFNRSFHTGEVIYG